MQVSRSRGEELKQRSNILPQSNNMEGLFFNVNNGYETLSFLTINLLIV